MTIRPFQHSTPPRTFSNFSDVTAWARDIYNTIFRLRQGKSENVGEITLTANVATTVLNDPRLSIQSLIAWDPKTPNATAELYGGTMFPSVRSSGQFTITHANNAQTDRSFFYAVIG
jgi:hypothetical protein